MSDLPANDLRLELRCRNNVLFHKIFDSHRSVSEFCEKYGLCPSRVGRLLNLTMSPFSKDGNPRPTAEKLCEIFGLGVLELFPLSLYRDILRGVLVAEVDSTRMLQFSQLRKDEIPLLESAAELYERRELSERVSLVLDRLEPKLRKVLTLRMGLGAESEHTLSEIGGILGVTPERVRQIEAKAMRKIRHPSMARHLKAFLDSPAVV